MAVQSSFQWISSKPSSMTPTHVKYPIMNEKQPINVDSNHVVAYLDDIHIGVFNNFGYLNNSSNFNKDIYEFIKSLNAHFMDMEKRINSIRENLATN